MEYHQFDKPIPLNEEDIREIEGRLRALDSNVFSKKQNLNIAIDLLDSAVTKFRRWKQWEREVPTLGAVEKLLRRVIRAGEALEAILDRSGNGQASSREAKRYSRAVMGLALALEPFGDPNPYGPRAFLSVDPPDPGKLDERLWLGWWVRYLIHEAECVLSTLYEPLKARKDDPPVRVVSPRSRAFLPWANRDLVVDCLTLWERFIPGRAGAKGKFREFVANVVYPMAMKPIWRPGEREFNDFKRELEEVFRKWRAMRGLPRVPGRPPKKAQGVGMPAPGSLWAKQRIWWPMGRVRLISRGSNRRRLVTRSRWPVRL